MLYKRYHAQRCVVIVTRYPSLVMVRSQSTIGRIRGIPNANIHHAFNERKYCVSTKKIAGCLLFFLYWNTIAAPPGKGQKNELHGENITSRKYSTNVPLFNSNTNPIINNNTLDATLQHTMETIYLMRHWIILEKKGRTKTLKNVGKTQQTQ